MKNQLSLLSSLSYPIASRPRCLQYIIIWTSCNTLHIESTRDVKHIRWLWYLAYMFTYNIIETIFEMKLSTPTKFVEPFFIVMVWYQVLKPWLLIIWMIFGLYSWKSMIFICMCACVCQFVRVATLNGLSTPSFST